MALACDCSVYCYYYCIIITVLPYYRIITGINITMMMMLVLFYFLFYYPIPGLLMDVLVTSFKTGQRIYILLLLLGVLPSQVSYGWIG